MNTYAPFSRPLYIMSKPAGAHCNLACDYCYYLEKAKLYQQDTANVMSDELTEIFVREYIRCQTTQEIIFTWHGGEPMIRPLDYYRKIVRLQKHYAEGHTIINCIQTNGTLLTPEWCRFLHQEGWLTGISIDGPETMHDAYRTRRNGKPTWNKVMHAIDMLDRYGVEWNAMAVVNDITAQHPAEFYHFFRDELCCKYLQFTPIVERIMHHSDGRHLAHMLDSGEDITLAPFSVTPRQWGDFLNTIFDDWVRHDIGEMFVQIFDATLANWMGVTPGVCTLSNYCGHAAVMEHNGDIYCCDHFVFPEYRLGNIKSHNLWDMMNGERQQTFAKMKTEGLPSQCRQCKWQFACHGECPRNRFVTTPDSEQGLNYLCQGYQAYFSHVAPYMDMMKKKLDEGKAPAEIMSEISW